MKCFKLEKIARVANSVHRGVSTYACLYKGVLDGKFRLLVTKHTLGARVG